MIEMIQNELKMKRPNFWKKLRAIHTINKYKKLNKAQILSEEKENQEEYKANYSESVEGTELAVGNWETWY